MEKAKCKWRIPFLIRRTKNEETNLPGNSSRMLTPGRLHRQTCREVARRRESPRWRGRSCREWKGRCNTSNLGRNMHTWSKSTCMTKCIMNIAKAHTPFQRRRLFRNKKKGQKCRALHAVDIGRITPIACSSFTWIVCLNSGGYICPQSCHS